jgi:hypothetical protein
MIKAIKIKLSWEKLCFILLKIILNPFVYLVNLKILTILNNLTILMIRRPSQFLPCPDTKKIKKGKIDKRSIKL